MLSFILWPINRTKTNIIKAFYITHVKLILTRDKICLFLIFCRIVFLVEEEINIRLRKGLLNFYFFEIFLKRSNSFNYLFIPILPKFRSVSWKVNKIGIEVI